MPHWQKALLVLAFSSALSSCQPPGEKARKELEKAGLPVTAATAVQAATSGTVATLEMLRTAGVDLGSAPDAHSPTPLIAAIKANSGAVALLLGSTAPDKIDGKDELGRTALSYAVASHQTALALEILAKQARPALTNHPEQDVISDAIKQNQPALVAKLIEATPSADPLLTPALATAVACSSTETVKQLIAHQATLPPPTTSSRSLLAVAAEQTNVDILRSLTEAGAKAPTDLSAEGNPITLAVKTDHLEMAQLLLKAGYHPDTPDRDGGTATGMAASQKRLPLLALFLDHHAAAQPQLQSALIGRDFPVLDLLLSHGATPDTPDAEGNPPLIQAVLKKDVELTRYLLSKQAPLESTGYLGQTALGLAVVTGPRALVESLLEAGANANTTFNAPAKSEFLALSGDDYFNTWMGRDTLITPLMLTASRGDLDMMRLLMKHGAKRGAQTKDWKRYAVNFACEQSQIPAAQLLLGQDPDAQRDVKVVVSLSKQRATIYRDGKVVRSSDISTGKTGFTTPSGKYVISDKQADWKSSIYKVPMPFFMRLSCRDFGLHAGVVSGSGHASHGCVRLPKDQAAAFFQVMEIGDPVTIEN